MKGKAEMAGIFSHLPEAVSTVSNVPEPPRLWFYNSAETTFRFSADTSVSWGVLYMYHLHLNMRLPGT